MRTRDSGGRDRILAAVEITALGLWAGSLAGFAFVEAPLAFHIVGDHDLAAFAALIGATLGMLTGAGYVLGGAGFLAAAVRAVRAGDRRYDMLRVLLIAIALGLSVYHQHAIAAAMTQIADVHSPAYHALHARSSTVYGLVLLLAMAALVLGAARGSED